MHGVLGVRLLRARSTARDAFNLYTLCACLARELDTRLRTDDGFITRQNNEMCVRGVNDVYKQFFERYTQFMMFS